MPGTALTTLTTLSHWMLTIALYGRFCTPRFGEEEGGAQSVTTEHEVREWAAILSPHS